MAEQMTRPFRTVHSLSTGVDISYEKSDRGQLLTVSGNPVNWFQKWVSPGKFAFCGGVSLKYTKDVFSDKSLVNPEEYELLPLELRTLIERNPRPGDDFEIGTLNLLGRMVTKCEESIWLYDEMRGESELNRLLSIIYDSSVYSGGISLYNHSLLTGLLAIDLGFENENCNESEKALKRRTLGRSEMDLIGKIAFLHDTGRSLIPQDRNKLKIPKRERQTLMGLHSLIGCGITGIISERYDYANGIIQHHEFKKDGKNKTEGWANKKILQATVIADMFVDLAYQGESKHAFIDGVNTSVYKFDLSKSEIEERLREDFKGDPKYIDQVLDRLRQPKTNMEE